MKTMQSLPLTLAALTLAPALAASTPKDAPEWKPSLTAAESPAMKPWEDGATIALSSVDGQSVAVADAVFKLERTTDTPTANGFARAVSSPKRNT